jgi:hypothetical protein
MSSPMPKSVEIQGRDYHVNVKTMRGNTASGNVEVVIELYDGKEEPSWTNGVPSVPPVQTIRLSGDAGTLYYQFQHAVELLNDVRSW